jgi:hypothetical protein
MTATTYSGKGGARPGAGRPAGAPNKKTASLLEEIKASGQTPIEFLIEVMRDVTEEKTIRVDAAKSVAPYLHAKLASIDVKADVHVHEAFISGLAGGLDDCAADD